MKKFIRNSLGFLRLDLTTNLKYDRLTKYIIKKHLKKSSNCIDIGCHKGEILDILLNEAPLGKHFAFEPIPDFYSALKNKYKEVKVFPYALGAIEGVTEFNYVKNDPAYSGLKEREYSKKDPKIEKLKVQVKKLDEVIPSDIQIDFIKIDVEGGEYGVLKGGLSLIKKHRPLILFEFGLGASDYYNIKPEDIHTIFSDLKYRIYTLKGFISGESELDLTKFKSLYFSKKEYYFVASPKNSIDE